MLKQDQTKDFYDISDSFQYFWHFLVTGRSFYGILGLFVSFWASRIHIFTFSAVFGQKNVFFKAKKMTRTTGAVFPVVWNTFGDFLNPVGCFSVISGFSEGFGGQK